MKEVYINFFSNLHEKDEIQTINKIRKKKTDNWNNLKKEIFIYQTTWSPK